jgi:hypothetical protein
VIRAAAGQHKSFPQNIASTGKLIRPVALASVFLLADFFMAQRADVARGREIIERWCVLAEQRLEHLTELFETGRWRRYHSEHSFLENIQEAKTAVEAWRKLASREALPDNSAVDLSWLNSPRPLPPRRNPLSGYYAPPESLRRADAPQVPGSLLKLVIADPAPDIAPAAAGGWQQALDPAAMQERYPLLRNAL